MLRYHPALVLILASLLIGCGGGIAPKSKTPSGGNGNDVPGTLSVSTPTISFGNVNVGSSTDQTATLAAATSAVTIFSGSWSGNGFSVSGITFPVTLVAGQIASFTVKFAPQASGAASGAISFVSNAANSPTTAALAGTGVPTGNVVHKVSLFWNASPSQVIGYNVYRGTTSGGPYPLKLTPSPQAATSLVDNSVAAGTTYYYVATSVDQSSIESIYSNQITMTVP